MRARLTAPTAGARHSPLRAWRRPEKRQQIGVRELLHDDLGNVYLYGPRSILGNAFVSHQFVLRRFDCVPISRHYRNFFGARVLIARVFPTRR